MIDLAIPFAAAASHGPNRGASSGLILIMFPSFDASSSGDASREGIGGV